MLRRLHPNQPDSFAFTDANQAWAEAQMTKFPEGRQASAIIPLLWRAQEQEGWLTRPAIERVAEMLDMAYMRALEVASFYFMFQLQPVGGVAHFQICGTTTCMICGAEDLVRVCREKIAAKAHEISSDGKFSWEEVECLGACANAPMAQVGKDYYEDLTAVRLGEIIDEMAAGEIPAPGPQNGRFAAEPLAGLTSLTAHAAGREALNASVGLASTQSDTLKRIDGTELPLIMPWLNSDDRGPALDPSASARPTTLAKARDGGPDKLTKIKGIGPKLQELLFSMGFFHFDQIASWDKSQVAWVDENLDGFKGRASRDDWVAQAFSLSGSSVGGVK
ncbi:NADH-quinone oxidoreductase subunit NuoE [Paracoccaceae bacterium]|nr:NADH-quinone oxidoreductase subunit NuoE [Paracoccaceae bacterium]